MNPKSLTESGWKATALKYKVKDNGLQRALAGYERLEEDEYDDRLRAIGSVSQLAGSLKRSREVAEQEEVVSYLEDVVDAAESEKRAIIKAKAEADKTAKAAAATAAADDAQAAKEEKEEDNYVARLSAAFQKLKGSRGLAYEFIVCDAKPFCAVMVAKSITAAHKAELTKVTDGGKRFLHVGSCSFEEGKFNFTMEQPVSGLARKLQDSIKNFTGKKYPIVVGAETAEEGDA